MVDTREIYKLFKMLVEAGIPCRARILYDGAQVVYPSYEKRICDAVCHSGSYGHEKGLLEIMGLVDEDVGDDVEGYLTAEQVFKRIQEDYLLKR